MARTIAEHNAASAKKGLLRVEQVMMVKQRLMAGDKPSVIAALLGVSIQTVERIRDGKTWSWVQVKADTPIPHSEQDMEKSLELLAKAMGKTANSMVNELKKG